MKIGRPSLIKVPLINISFYKVDLEVIRGKLGVNCASAIFLLIVNLKYPQKELLIIRNPSKRSLYKKVWPLLSNSKCILIEFIICYVAIRGIVQAVPAPIQTAAPCVRLIIATTSRLVSLISTKDDKILSYFITKVGLSRPKTWTICSHFKYSFIVKRLVWKLEVKYISLVAIVKNCLMSILKVDPLNTQHIVSIVCNLFNQS